MEKKQIVVMKKKDAEMESEDMCECPECGHKFAPGGEYEEEDED